MKLKIVTIIFILTILGAFLRLYKLGSNPIGLNVDEVSIGYNAYSILKTGKDEYGKAFPLTFKSLGDYKPPVYIYLTVPSIALFGLNEFAVRFPSAFIATLAIPFFYFFLLYFVQDKRYAIAGSILLTISPWHLYFSRLASETSVATILTLVGVFCLLKLLRGGLIWSVIAAFFLILPMYTYHSERLFIPLFTLAVILFNRKKILNQRAKLVHFVIFSFIFAIPLIFSLILGADTTRLQMTVISNDINLTRYISFKPSALLVGLPGAYFNFFGNDWFLLFFFWARKYLAYLQPSFLFYNGLDMTTTDTYGLGVMYLFEIPFFIAGIITLLKKTIQNKALIISWILIGIFPASLTLSERQPFRSHIILPMVVLISAIGSVELFEQIRKITPVFKKRIIFFMMGIFIAWNLIQALLIFSVHFPRERGEYFMEGTKEAIIYVLDNKSKYNEIVFDPKRGTEGPYITSVPHLYYLFYSKYDPLTYQNEIKTEKDGAFSFDNFTVRQITWLKDLSKSGTLFIGSPWSFPEKDMKDGEIIKKIYLSNGNVAFFVVSPKR